MTPLQQNLLSELHDGEHCYFTKYEHLGETLNEIATKKKTVKNTPDTLGSKK